MTMTMNVSTSREQRVAELTTKEADAVAMSTALGSLADLIEKAECQIGHRPIWNQVADRLRLDAAKAGEMADKARERLADLREAEAARERWQAAHPVVPDDEPDQAQ